MAAVACVAPRTWPDTWPEPLSRDATHHHAIRGTRPTKARGNGRGEVDAHEHAKGSGAGILGMREDAEERPARRCPGRCWGAVWWRHSILCLLYVSCRRTLHLPTVTHLEMC